MTMSPSSAEERVLHLVRDADDFRATPEDVARWIGGDVEDARDALDELVARNVIRRHEIPGEGEVYWS